VLFKSSKIQIIITISFTIRLLYAILANPESNEIAHFYNQPVAGNSANPFIHFLTNLVQLENTQLQLRLPLVILFSISLYLFYKITTDMFNQKVATFATLILHTFPIFLYTGCSASHNSLFIFFFLMVWFIIKKYYRSIYHHSDFIAGLIFLFAMINDFIAILMAIPITIILFTDKRSISHRYYRILSFIIGITISCIIYSILGYSLSYSEILTPFTQYINSTELFIKLVYHLSPWLIVTTTLVAIYLLFSLHSRNHDSNRNSLIEILSWLIFFSFLIVLNVNNKEIITTALMVVLPCVSIFISYTVYHKNLVQKLTLTLSLFSIICSMFFYMISWTSIRNASPAYTLNSNLVSSQFKDELNKQASQFIQQSAGIKSFAKSLKAYFKDDVFIFTDNKDLSLQLGFYLKKRVYYFGKGQQSLKNNGEFLAKNAIFITQNSVMNFKSEISKHFKKVDFLKEVSVTKDKNIFKRFFIYSCKTLKFPFNYELQEQS
jgi:hypothetical protein